MNPEEKANELVEKFKDYVHGYVGSSMLTNYEYPEQILSQAKKASMIVVNEVLENTPMYTGNLNPKWKYWNDVKTALNNIN